MTTTKRNPDLLRRGEAARELGWPKGELDKFIAAGLVPTERLYGRTYIRRAALRAWLRGEDGHAGARRQG